VSSRRPGFAAAEAAAAWPHAGAAGSATREVSIEQ
jgi:hypothetical protein